MSFPRRASWRASKEFKPAAQTRLQWMLFYFLQRTERRTHLPAFWHQPADFLSLARRFDRHDLTTVEERSHRPRTYVSPLGPPHWAERVLALRKQYPAGEGQTGGAARSREALCFVSMAGRILSALKRRRRVARTPQARPLAATAPQTAQRPWPFASLILAH